MQIYSHLFEILQYMLQTKISHSLIVIFYDATNQKATLGKTGGNMQGDQSGRGGDP